VRSGALEQISIADYPGWVAGARWLREQENDVYLFSIHSPTPNKSEPQGSYVAESLKIVAAICENIPSSGSLVIGGDFNFKSLGERLVSEAIRTEETELQALREFRERGLSIAWRDSHPEEPLPQTLRWNPAQTTPYHCDGFLTRGFLATGIICDIICSESEAQHSDHNPVFLQLSRSAAA